MLLLDDTIAAVSTPIGQGGIGIVRLSGPEALPIARALFAPGDVGAWRAPASHRLYYGHIQDPADGRTVDEVLLAYMAAPHTYTRQDVVEIDAHGGVVPLREILALALRHGARPAEPGEFTLRAFLNGRLDLAQAEAVQDVVTARTPAALQMALGQLDGRLSSRVQALRSDLLDVLAYLEATIDFGEEDIPPQDIGPALAAAADALADLVGEAERGLLYRQGVRTAIVGRPNVGKSSLLNALLRADRAIVTPIPGTTRDTLEETINLQGIPLVLVDTAGIAGDSSDPIERLGIERSRRALQTADLALLVVDGSVPPAPADAEVAALLAGIRTVVVANKCDLAAGGDYGALLPDAPRQAVSALTGQGLGDLETLLVEVVLAGRGRAEGDPLASNPRHGEAFRAALGHVEDARRAAAAGLPPDLVAIDVTAAVETLGEVTGEDVGEDVLERIFGRFCIGK